MLYVYESPAGYGLLVLRLIGWGLFVYATAFTLKHYPEKNGFYLPFFFFASLWSASYFKYRNVSKLVFLLNLLLK